MELCGEAVPAVYDSAGSGVMPGKAQRCQMGRDETLEYRAMLDLDAKEVPIREAWKAMVDASEAALRVITKAPLMYTVGQALREQSSRLHASILTYKATAWRLRRVSLGEGKGRR